MFVIVRAFAVVVPAWKVPTTVDEACDTKPACRVPRPMRLKELAPRVPIVAVLALRLVVVAPPWKSARSVVVAPPKMVSPVDCVPPPMVVEARSMVPALKMFWPLKVLLFERRVVDAAPMVMEPPSETALPLTVMLEFAKSELPIEVEATSLLFASVVTMELPVMLGAQMVPKVASVVDDCWRLTSVEKVVDALKMFWPLKVLLLARSVEEAAVMVMEPPTESD